MTARRAPGNRAAWDRGVRDSARDAGAAGELAGGAGGRQSAGDVVGNARTSCLENRATRRRLVDGGAQDDENFLE